MISKIPNHWKEDDEPHPPLIMQLIGVTALLLSTLLILIILLNL